MTTGQIVLALALAAALVFGLWRAYADGRFRGTHPVKGGPKTDSHPDQLNVWAEVVADPRNGVTGEPGERATLLQFSSAFCAPCRVTRRVLGEVTDVVEGVRHVEIDAEHHLELVRALGILRTPTTLVLNPTGHEVGRAAGAPSKDQVFTALAAL
jgi:thiol-disulfide isomerase/thioredoxin